jgi:hypothetical protein
MSEGVNGGTGEIPGTRSFQMKRQCYKSPSHENGLCFGNTSYYMKGVGKVECPESKQGLGTDLSRTNQKICNVFSMSGVSHEQFHE